MAEAVITGIGLFALYLLFTGQMNLPEAGAGMLCALVSVGFRLQVRLQAERKLHFRLGWWPRLIGQVAISLAQDSLRVGLRLLAIITGRDLPGHEAKQHFQPGGFTPQAAGRRGVAVLATSMAPDSFVLQIEPDAMRLHRLVGGSDPMNTP